MSAILELSQPRCDAPSALSASALPQVGRIHASLDPAQIVRDFAAALAPALAWQGLAWLPPLGSDIEPLFLGRERACQCHYTLSAGGQPLGELILSRRQPFPPESIAILEELLCGLVFPLDNALLYQSARRAAATDALTGLANRGVLEHHLERELTRARRNGAPLSVLLVDVDRFKQLNDRYGRALGDRVLVTVARAPRPAPRAARRGPGLPVRRR